MLLPKDQDSNHQAGSPPIAEPTQETVRFETVAGPPRRSGQKNKFASTMLGLAPLPPAEPAPAREETPVPSAEPHPAAAAPAPAPSSEFTAFVPTVSAKPRTEPYLSQSMEAKRRRSTMLGLAFNLPQAPPTIQSDGPSGPTNPPQPDNGGGHHSTMLGMPSVQTQQLSSTTPESPVTEPNELTSSEGDAKHSTMLGIPSSLTQTNPTNQSAKTLLGQGAFSASPPLIVALPLDSGKGTLIGVATPGIAPSNPGVAKAAPKEPGKNSVVTSEPPHGKSQELGASARARPRSVGHTVFWSLSSVAMVLALVSLAAVWRWRASPKLDVQVQSDEAGNDSLAIECKNCDENVSFSIGNAKTTVRSHHATIPLRTPLKIGPNRVSVTMTRGTHRPEVIQLNFPVDYRLTGDLSGLEENPAKLRLKIEKTSSVDFQVNNEPVHFDVAGKGQFDLDVSKDLIGPSSQEKLLEKRIGYQVRGANGNRASAIVLRTTIAPLVVTAPGSVFVTEGSDLRICGQTDTKSRVEIAGLQASVDKNGTFCSAAVIREFGKFDVWVTAHRPGAAPRKLKLVIERTANLREYAKALYPRVAHEVPQVRKPTYDDPLSLIALTGVVVDQSNLAHATRYLLKYDASTNTSSFARINSFSTKASKTGSQVTVFGEPTTELPGPDGRTMVELNAAFELPALR